MTLVDLQDRADESVVRSLALLGHGSPNAYRAGERRLVGWQIADVIRDGDWVERHAWNRLPAGVSVDLTRSQFTRGEVLGEAVAGEPLMRHRARYDLLADRVRARLAASR